MLTKICTYSHSDSMKKFSGIGVGRDQPKLTCEFHAFTVGGQFLSQGPFDQQPSDQRNGLPHKENFKDKFHIFKQICTSRLPFVAILTRQRPCLPVLRVVLCEEISKLKHFPTFITLVFSVTNNFFHTRNNFLSSFRFT